MNDSTQPAPAGANEHAAREMFRLHVLDHAFRSLPDMVIVTDQFNTLMLANDLFMVRLGYVPEDLQNRAAITLLASEHMPGFALPRFPDELEPGIRQPYHPILAYLRTKNGPPVAVDMRGVACHINAEFGLGALSKMIIYSFRDMDSMGALTQQMIAQMPPELRAILEQSQAVSDQLAGGGVPPGGVPGMPGGFPGGPRANPYPPGVGG